MHGQIRFAVEHAVATLTIDHPTKLNAMSLAMWRAIPALVAQAVADPAVRVIVVTGAGDKAFCAGADISRFGTERTGAEAVAAYDAAVEQAETALAQAAKPTVALIGGLCFGGGLGLAIACDLRLCSDAARFRLPAARLGIGYGLPGVARLTQRLGFAAAAEILFTARIFDAAEAKGLGIVSRISAAERFAQDSASLLADIAGNAPLSLMAAKSALVELEKPESERDASAVDAAVAACYESADYAEGQLAFAQKRAPIFQGH